MGGCGCDATAEASSHSLKEPSVSDSGLSEPGTMVPPSAPRAPAATVESEENAILALLPWLAPAFREARARRARSTTFGVPCDEEVLRMLPWLRPCLGRGVVSSLRGASPEGALDAARRHSGRGPDPEARHVMRMLPWLAPAILSGFVSKREG